MKKLLIICVIFCFASCREKSELDGVYVNQRSDTLDMYHTHDDNFRVRLSTQKDLIFVKRRGDLLEQKTGSDSVILTVKILPEKRLELKGEVFGRVSDGVK